MNIDSYYSDYEKYFITVSQSEKSYEVGIRTMENGNFKLIASCLNSENQAKEIGRAVKTLLDSGEWEPEQIRLVATGLSGIAPKTF